MTTLSTWAISESLAEGGITHALTISAEEWLVIWASSGWLATLNSFNIEWKCLACTIGASVWGVNVTLTNG